MEYLHVQADNPWYNYYIIPMHRSLLHLNFPERHLDQRKRRKRICPNSFSIDYKGIHCKCFWIWNRRHKHLQFLVHRSRLGDPQAWKIREIILWFRPYSVWTMTTCLLKHSFCQEGVRLSNRPCSGRTTLLFPELGFTETKSGPPCLLT